MDSYFKNEVMDRELAKVALQDKDLQSKVRAIEHYNKLRKRIDGDDETKPQKVEVAFRWEDPEPRPAAKITKIK